MDSDNILSILASLGSGQDPQAAPASAPTNVLQQVAPQQPQAPQAPVVQPAHPADVVAAATAAAPAMPQPRHSLLDTIGRISDVFAKVGGADPLYQPTLDATTARTNAASDHDLATQKAQLDLTTDKFDLSDKQREAADSERSRFASVLGAVNDAEDAAKMPDLMAAAGLTDARYAPFVKMVQANPETAKTLASALGGGADDSDKLGKNLFFGTTTTGKTVAYQIGPDGKPHILDFGGGITPDEPIKVVNTGGSNVIVGGSGLPKTIIPNTASPNTVLTTTTNQNIAAGHDKTQITVAGMPARPTAAAAGKGSDPSAGLKIISNIQQSFDNLHNLQALPGEGGAVGNILGTIGRTSLGQAIGATTGLSAAAQERELLAKNLASLQSDLIKSLPGNATRTRFEQLIQQRRLPNPATMSYPTANRAIAQIRDDYTTALNSQPKTVVPAAGNIPTLSPSDAAKLPKGSQFRTSDGRILVRN